MTVNEIVTLCEFNVLSLPFPDREVSGCYIGDLLSWVMGRAREDNVWITIMSNINTIAVASLADVSLVILAEGVTLDEDVLAAAKEKNINVVTSDLAAFETAGMLFGKV